MYIRHTWPAMLWSVIVLVLTLIPGNALPEVHFFQVDKVVHVFIFGMLMILTSYGLWKVNTRSGFPVRPILKAALYSIFFGIMIEVIQQFVPGRNYSLADVLANSVGVALGYYIFWLLALRT